MGSVYRARECAVININPIPYGILMLVLFVAGGIWLYNKGATDCRTEYQAKHAESLTRAITQANEQAAIDASILRAASERDAVSQKINEKIITKVVRYVSLNPSPPACDLDDCRMCLKHSAAIGTDPAGCPCGTNDVVRITGGIAEPITGRSALRLHGDSGTTEALPGYTFRAGELGQVRGGE